LASELHDIISVLINEIVREMNLTLGDMTMLRLAIIFFVIALIAGGLGLGGTAGASMGVANVFFFVFIVLAVLEAIGGFFRGAGNNI